MFLLLLFAFFSLGAEEVEQEWEWQPHAQSSVESRHRGRIQRPSPATFRTHSGIATLCLDVPSVDDWSHHPLAASSGAPSQLESMGRTLPAFESPLTRGPPPAVAID